MGEIDVPNVTIKRVTSQIKLIAFI